MRIISSCSDEIQGTAKKNVSNAVLCMCYCPKFNNNPKFIDKNHIEAVFHWLVIRLLKVIAPALNVGQ